MIPTLTNEFDFLKQDISSYCDKFANIKSNDENLRYDNSGVYVSKVAETLALYRNTLQLAFRDY